MKIVPFLKGKERQKLVTDTTNQSQLNYKTQAHLNPSCLQQNKNNQSQNLNIHCAICLHKKKEYFYFAECFHVFCKKCLQSHLNQTIKQHKPIRCCETDCQNQLFRGKNQQGQIKYIWEVLSRRDRKKIMKHLFNLMKIKERCSQCKFNEEQQKIEKCPKCMEEESIMVPEDMKKCPLCRKIIEKIKGCDHLKCPCGFQFCFVCNQKWTHSHICQSKIPVRTGPSYCLFLFFKILLVTILGLIMLTISIIFTIAICTISSLLFGPIMFTKCLQKLQQFQISDICKCGLFAVIFLFIPIFLAIGIIPGFFLPLINIFWGQKILLNPDILPDIYERLFGCILTVKLI